MPFADIVGHEKQLETLRRGLERGRLHHAYLFLGPEGVGKKSVALSLAMAIHCADREYDFCGECQNCHRIRAGNHPDVRLIEPPAGKKEIGIPQIRELERELAFRAFSRGKKVAILDPADLMNYHAQNSLLKTLEEPPGDSLLILIAKSMGSLLPTLVSRCLRLSFGAPGLDAVTEVLARRKGIPMEEAKLLARLTMGSLGEALGCDTEELLNRRREWIERLDSLAPGDYSAVMALAEEVAGDREACLKFLRCMEGWYRDILLYQIGGWTEQIRNVDMEKTLRERSRSYRVEHTLSVLARAGAGAREIQRNFNRRLVLENILMKIVSSS
ncbi:MAG: DNA polymerase III subunit delta' [Candidatus Binatia bacterium]